MTGYKMAYVALVAVTVLAALRCGTDTPSGRSNPPPVSHPFDTAAFVADTMQVRAILDSNKLLTTSVWGMLFISKTVALDTNSRIAALNLQYFPLPITRLPAQIGGLTELVDLRLNNQSLTSLPPEIGRLTKLKLLYLNVNKITQLPRELSKCTALEHLYISSNGLVRLPDSLGNCTALTKLELGFNDLTNLPDSIIKLSSVQISVMKNRLCRPELSDAIERWLDDHAVEGTDWADTIRYQTCP